MDTAVVVALISSLASLGIAGVTAVVSGRQSDKTRKLQADLTVAQSAAQRDLEMLKHQLQQTARRDEQLDAARTQLDRYREPLLLAVHDLGDRLDNIRHRGFLGYLRAGGARGETALLSTLFRVARYFARLEMLYQDVSLLRFERDEDTKAVAQQLALVGGAFATDRHDRFMLWRDEQRAIGELMCSTAEDGSTRCAGYSSFVEDYETRYSPWLASFGADLQAAGAARDARLAELLQHLAGLMVELDNQALFVRAGDDGRPASPAWVARAMREH